MITLSDHEVVVDDLRDGGKAVGGARGVGDNVGLGLVFLVVDSEDVEGSVILGRGRNDNLLGSSSEVLGCSFGGEEFSGGFTNSGDSKLSPRDFGGIGFGVESDFLSVNENAVVPEFNFMVESKMGGVVLQEVLEVLGIHEGVIDYSDVQSLGDFEG